MNALGTAALMGATLTTAMVAGLLFCFAHLVMPGLGTMDDRGYLTAFQRIDAAIPNPWMMLTFLGSPVLTLAALVVHVTGDSPAVPWLGLALVLVAATVVITAAVHLPLNAAVQAAAPQFADAAGMRDRFEMRWVRWNIARTVTSVGALAALSWALVISGRTGG
ncbi:MAG TPA: anthrone oxygenase family protein [Ornithinibacter sp.]|nr:anthrone oxygenase family protein [Ornithinibacter sp.]